MMALPTRKKLLGLLIFVTTITLIVSFFYLNGMTAHSTKQKSLLSSESGRLVARSQFDFHHIIEQWVQENGMNNHSKRRKERLIEDGHVIREAIEYGEGENENRNYEKGGRDVQMNKSVYHLNSMLDNKSFHKRDNLSKQSSANEKLHSPSHIHGRTASGLVNASKSSQKEMLSSKRQGQKVKQKSLPFSNKTKSEKIKNKSLDGQRNSTVDSSQVLLHTETLESKSGIDEKQLRNTSNSSIPVEVDGSEKAAGGAKVKQRSLPQSVKMSLSDTSKNTSAKPGTNQAVTKRAADIHNKMPLTSVSGGKKTDLTSRKTNVASNSLPEKESNSEKNQDTAVRIVSVDSHGQVIRYVKQHEGKLSKSNTKLEIPLEIDRPKHSDTRAKEIDFDSDPKYVHLPAVVRKKLANIHKDRLNKIKFLQVIRKRCEGRKYCLSNVRADERYLQNNCFHDAIKMEREYRVEIQPCKCSMFRTSTVGRGKKIISLQSKPHPRVALVSLPGSGNTWVRGLLEQATGYCTGSMWCDPILRAKQFCAEGVRANTLVVKNHDPTIRWVGQKLPINSTDHDLTKPQFNSAIFVHRNPYEATIAEWNRALGFLIFNASRHNQTVAGIGVYNSSNVVDQHTITFGKEAFGTNADWNRTIYTQMKSWETMINHLMINNTGGAPVLLVKYEDLKHDPFQEVERMVTFLDVNFDLTFKEKLNQGFHTFHRNHTYTFDHYTHEQKVYMNSVIRRVAERLKANDIDYFHVDRYIRN